MDGVQLVFFVETSSSEFVHIMTDVMRVQISEI